MRELDRICHNCKYCRDKHDSDKGIPNGFCEKYNQVVIEYHMLCEEIEPSEEYLKLIKSKRKKKSTPKTPTEEVA